MTYWITLGKLGLTIKFLTRIMDMTKTRYHLFFSPSFILSMIEPSMGLGWMKFNIKFKSY
jgi:hypothetical protein